MKYYGFEPCFNNNAKILILGSFPSVLSRESVFYYGNPRNRFWSVLAKAFLRPLPNSINEKKVLVYDNKIALWDMVTECEIKGSLDSNIKNYKVADLNKVLKFAKIEKFLLNGQKSFSIFKKSYPHLLNMAHCLPSTSPANFKFDESKWLTELTNL